LRAATAAPAAQSAAAPGSSFDVLVKGGTVYDGSGGAAMRADVGVNGDKIAAVGDLSAATGKTIVDATGLAVAPGFVNMMSGDDSLRVDGRSMSDLKQGVTLEIMGEGYSMGPLTDDMRRMAIEAQGDLKYPVTWKTLHEGMLDLQNRGVSTNFASFIGAATLRQYAIGDKDKPPTTAQLDIMRKLVAEEMDAGALGIASALIYAPGFYAKTE
jgi:N-acyl-D-amino-acid deacylase